MSAPFGYGPAKPLRIVALTQTCGACPSQWEGVSDHGAAVYARYRGGRLRVHVGPGVGAAIDLPPVWEWAEGEPLDGWMDLGELRERLPGWIVVEEGTVGQRLVEVAPGEWVRTAAEETG